MDKLLSFPTLALILGPFESGKTSLLKYLILENISNIVCIVIFSNTGRDTYESNYGFVNERYVYSEWDSDIIDKLIRLGKKIKRANPKHELLVVFDDSIGMAKNIFSGKESKKLLTTLRHYNISIIISTHQLQSEVTTLIRNNLKDIFLFNQNEPHGIKMLTETWGKSSTNLNEPKEFQNTLLALPKNNFLHYNKNTRVWKTGTIPYPLPDFRVYLHPSDHNCDKQVVPGNYFGDEENARSYDLSPVERSPDELQSDEEEGNSCLYRNEKGSESGEEFIEDLGKDLKENRIEEEEVVPKNKRRRKDAATELLEQIDEPKQLEEKLANLSKNDLIIRGRILNILKYIQTEPNNPDQLLLNYKEPAFLQQNFDDMDFDQLKDAYRVYCNHKTMNQMIGGVHSKYNMIGDVVTNFARRGLGYEGPTGFLTTKLSGLKHESVLSSLARSHPYKKMEISTVDKILDAAYPVLSGLLSVYNYQQQLNTHNARAQQPIGEEEIRSYINHIPPAPHE